MIERRFTLSKNLKIFIESTFQPTTKEEIQQKINELAEKLNKQKVNLDVQLPPGTLSKFIESRKKLKTTLNLLFPSLDADKFIDFVITSPIKAHVFEFETLINLFNFFQGTASNYIRPDFELITNSQPHIQKEQINGVSYLEIFLIYIFPILQFLLGQYQTHQTTEQLNRIENKIDQYIEQQNKLENNQKLIIELPNDFSAGPES
jgi:hypothetical protein